MPPILNDMSKLTKVLAIALERYCDYTSDLSISSGQNMSLEQPGCFLQ